MTAQHVKEYIQDVKGAVEANSFETFCLWNEYKKDWKEGRSGFMQTIGHIGDRPVNLTLMVHEIKGSKILFYECVSQVADYAMIDHWIETELPRVVQRQMRTNAMNFHNIINRL